MPPASPIDWILWSGGVAGALTAIGSLLWRLLGAVKRLADAFQDDREEAVYCRKWTLRQAIVNPTFPDVERLEAYERYCGMGGNGYMEEYAAILRDRMGGRIVDEFEGGET